MQLIRICVLLRTHFLIVLTGLVCMFVHPGSAHNVVLSEYSLQYQNEQWVLKFDQKTSYLRDAIYATRPDLKGINLNSQPYLQATADHIATNLTLKYEGDKLRITPQHMKYGGLKFESTFIVEGLSPTPDYLVIKTEGFDTHEHSVMLFRMTIGKDGYLNYFAQDRRLATFDFTKRSYVFEEMDAGGGYGFLVYVVLLVLVVGGVLVFWVRGR